MKYLSLSGWAQPADALASVCPPETEFFDYGLLDSVDACFAALSEKNPEVAVGWSLGGQILVRAIAAGIIKPKRLVLMAAPYQCCASFSFSFATPPAVLAQSRAFFQQDMLGMWKQFESLICMGHAQPKALLQELTKHHENLMQGHWLYWFDELVRFSCDELDFSHFPQTDIIHGEADVIVPVPQGERFASSIANAVLHRFPACGHAPHWYDREKVTHIVARSA